MACHHVIVGFCIVGIDFGAALVVIWRCIFRVGLKPVATTVGIHGGRPEIQKCVVYCHGQMEYVYNIFNS